MWLDKKHKKLRRRYPEKVGEKRMDFHIELISSAETPTDELLVRRAREIEGREISLEIKKLGNVLVLEIERYHITIAYFPEGVVLAE